MIEKNTLIGQKFNRLTVVGQHFSDIKKERFWLCICDCGNKTIPIPTRNLRNNGSGSCGCLKKERITKHGKRGIPEYSVWANIKKRCYNAKNKEYHNYGGRGIIMCDRWLNSFESFFEDIGKRPSIKHSLDRTNNDGIYEPNNCMWATSIEQNRNKRNNRWVEYNGEKLLIRDWAKKLKVDESTIRYQLKSRTFSEVVERFN